MIRYSVISEKNPREIVLLRGKGCCWRRCRFCDYHLDSSSDISANYFLNRKILQQVTGEFGKLEVINSGSFVDLDENTMKEIVSVCLKKKISEVHFECHWMHRKSIEALKEFFSAKGITVKIKIGVETFDKKYREEYLCKGIDEENPETIAELFDEVCLLQGLPGQTVFQMRKDIETGLRFFERVCVNIMNENSTSIHPDPEVIQKFLQEVAPQFIKNNRVDILMNNTDYGVGGLDE